MKDLYIDISCILITYPFLSKFCKESFSAMLLPLQLSIFLVSSFIKDFLLTVFLFNRKVEIKMRNTLMEFKYLLFRSGIDSFDVKDI